LPIAPDSASAHAAARRSAANPAAAHASPGTPRPRRIGSTSDAVRTTSEAMVTIPAQPVRLMEVSETSRGAEPSCAQMYSASAGATAPSCGLRKRAASASPTSSVPAAANAPRTNSPASACKSQRVRTSGRLLGMK
jgi:hypothetical protein